MQGDVMEETDFQRKQDIGYKEILMRHLDRISRLMSIIAGDEYGERNVLAFHFSVVGLETFLRPYLDGQYKQEKGELMKSMAAIKDGNGQGLLVTWSGSGGTSIELEYSLGLLGLLQGVMGRRNLLLEEDAVLKGRPD